MRKLFISFALAAVPSMPLMAAAPQAAPGRQAQPFDAGAVVGEVRRIISRRYVLAERRPALDAILARGLDSGRYAVTDPATLAQRINADLAAAGRDRHLGFSLNPSQAAMLAARRDEAAPDHSGFERQVRAANHGVTELRLLPGNIRYMAYDGFMWMGPESAAALDRAMHFLAGGDAIIIDVRRNGGGDSDASQYLLSHFLPANQPLFTYYREGGRVSRVFTLPTVPAGRIHGKPLYLLTSNSTASAAEEFTGNFAGYRLGEVIGEATAGAGFAADLVPIQGQFVLSLSIGRVLLASTGGDWEAKGISPTIPAAVPQALDAAHAHALRRIAGEAPAQERPGLEAIAEAIAARMEQRKPALPLAAYSGTFGERTVTEEDGKLYYRRGERPRTLLIPLGGHRFAFDNDPSLRLEFTAAGAAATAFTIVRAGAPAQGTYERNG